MDADSFIQIIAPLLKEKGFKKSKATWRRNQSESIAVLNVQKSPWDKERFYVNAGVYFSALGTLPAPTENQCHVQRRLDIDEPSLVVEKAIAWFHGRERLSDAARLADTDSKNGLVFKEVWSAR
jgi:hypothetical protein